MSVLDLYCCYAIIIDYELFLITTYQKKLILIIVFEGAELLAKFMPEETKASIAGAYYDAVCSYNCNIYD